MKNPVLLIALFLTIGSAFGQHTSQSELEKKVEELRALLIHPEQNELRRITSSQLSYGHSNGRIENQEEFIAYMLSGVSKFVTIELQNQTIDTVDNIGIVRHTIVAETNNEGETVHIKIGVLLVWHKEANDWKLLARQAFK